MASLTHVCVWSEQGWKHITAEEASILHPGGTVSAHSGLFMCELCGQYVTLTDGDQRGRYFKHSAYEISKDCPERTLGTNAAMQYNAKAHELPLRISNITAEDFNLEIGLLYIPSDILKKAAHPYVRMKSNEGDTFLYAFERLHKDCITYVSVGTVPSSMYYIETDPGLSLFWPSVIHGIPAGGCVFEQNTGKKLENDADVKVNSAYYYLGTQKLNPTTDHVVSKLVCRKKAGVRTWYVYEISAMTLSESSARFFLALHCRLTDRPLSLRPVWPLYRESPYVIQHNKDAIYMHLSGHSSSISAKTFPYAPIQKYSCGKGNVLKIACNNRQQLISAGRSNVLQYTYFWKTPLDTAADSPHISVTDRQGNRIEPGEYSILPPDEMIFADVPFDGFAEIFYKGHLRQRIGIRSNIQSPITGIQIGDTIQISQGMDVVWESKYIQKHEVRNFKEEQYLKFLKSFSGDWIPISHSIGAISRDLSNFPRIKTWLSQCIQRGFISQKALGYLQKILQKNK